MNFRATPLLPMALAGLIAACGGAGASPTPAGPNQSAGLPTPPGGSAATAAPGFTIDACTLLSDAEIAAATGYQVVDRQVSNLRPDVFPSICDIELDSGGSLTVSVRSTGGRSMYETSFEPFIGDADGYLDTALSGLGDKAGSAGDDTLMVLAGDVLFDVSYIEFGRNDKSAIVRYLAEIILAKLPCLAAGCPGFTPPPRPSSAVSDACALLTQDEVETATGFKVLETQPQSVPGQDPSCTWTFNTEPFPGADYVQLTIRETGGREEFDFLAGAYEPPLEHVTGIGDDAIKTATIPGGAVYAVIGDRLVTLQFTLPLAVDDPYALVVPLLALAAPRI